MIKKIRYSLLSFTFAFALVGCGSYDFKLDPQYSVKEKQDKVIISLKQGKEIKMDELVDEVEHYPVIFVGDHHNKEKTHKFFKEFLESLGKKGYNLHLANEWFTPEHDELLVEYTSGKIDSEDLRFERDWDKFTKYDWDLVSPLYETVKNYGGKLYGANISKKERKKISLRQFDKMDEQLKNFYNDLDLNVTSHQSLVMPFFAHCHKRDDNSSEDCAQRMYRVQVTWDKFMALSSDKIAKKVLKTKKDKLIVFAGAMHMEYGLGIPLRFARLNNTPYYILSNHRYFDNTEKIIIDPNKADSVFLYKDKMRVKK